MNAPKLPPQWTLWAAETATLSQVILTRETGEELHIRAERGTQAARNIQQLMLDMTTSGEDEQDTLRRLLNKHGFPGDMM